MQKPDNKRITIKEKGESLIIDHYKSILVLFKWNSARDIDFGAYYEATGRRRNFVFWGEAENLKAFPRISFEDEDPFNLPGPPNILRLRIDRDGDIERSRLMCFGAPHHSTNDTVPFHKIDLILEIYIKEKEGVVYEIVPAFTGTGNCTCLATIENIGESGVKIVNNGTVRAFDFGPNTKKDDFMDFARDI